MGENEQTREKTEIQRLGEQMRRRKGMTGASAPAFHDPQGRQLLWEQYLDTLCPAQQT